jgi:hypothetical protein
MNKLRYTLFLFFVLSFLSCATQVPLKEQVLEIEDISKEIIIEEIVKETTEEAARPEEKTLPEIEYVTIIAVGDNLYHDVMIRAGEQGGL